MLFYNLNREKPSKSVNQGTKSVDQVTVSVNPVTEDDNQEI